MQGLRARTAVMGLAMALSVPAGIGTAEAGIGKKLLGAAVVGGVAHHYYKKHQRNEAAKAQAHAAAPVSPANNRHVPPHSSRDPVAPPTRGADSV